MTTELSFVDFQCPYCGGEVSFPQDAAGSAQDCPNCPECVIVPEDGSAVGRKVPIPATTARLVLRRLRGLDWKDLIECQGGAAEEVEIVRWLESDAHVKLTTPGQPFFLGIEMAGGGKMVGYLSLSITDPQRLQAALDVTVNKGFQRQGVASEAWVALLDFCFLAIKLHRVTASCDSRNAAASRLCEKAGMRREGEFLKDRQINGEWTNTLWYALLREEFLAAQKSV